MVKHATAAAKKQRGVQQPGQTLRTQSTSTQQRLSVMGNTDSTTPALFASIHTKCATPRSHAPKSAAANFLMLGDSSSHHQGEAQDNEPLWQHTMLRDCQGASFCSMSFVHKTSIKCTSQAQQVTSITEVGSQMSDAIFSTSAQPYSRSNTQQWHPAGCALHQAAGGSPGGAAAAQTAPSDSCEPKQL